MEYILGVVRVYHRKLRRKLKNGKTKEYTTEQWSVTIQKDHNFQDGEDVVIISQAEHLTINNKLKDYENLEVKLKELEALENDLSDIQEKYNILTETSNNQVNELNRLRNKHDHLQERFNKSLKEENRLLKVISDLSNRGFRDYIFGRLPESYKQLQSPKHADEDKGEV